MDPGTARFISRDTWAKEYNMFMNPMVEKRIFMKRSRMFDYIFCLSVGLAVFGCSENNENRPSITPSRTASTVMTTPSRTPPPASTATPMITPTLIPAPTLPPDEAQALVLDLLYNPPCDLPCWWGIMPGETTWEEADRLLSSIGYPPGGGFIPGQDTFPVDYFFKVPDEVNEFRGSINVTLGVMDGIVKEIQIMPGKVTNYSLSRNLAMHGPPDEIWVDRDSEGPSNYVTFSYYLFYRNLGIIIGEDAIKTIVSEYRVLACLNSSHVSLEGPLIILWEPDQQISFLSKMNLGFIYRGPGPYPEDEYLLLEEIEINGMDEQGFYDIFVNPSTEYCIKTPRDKWPYIDVQ